jgi:hypothetical protein
MVVVVVHPAANNATQASASRIRRYSLDSIHDTGCGEEKRIMV